MGAGEGVSIDNADFMAIQRYVTSHRDVTRPQGAPFRRGDRMPLDVGALQHSKS